MLYCKFGFLFSHHLSSRWIKKKQTKTLKWGIVLWNCFFFFQSAYLILFQKLQIVTATVEESLHNRLRKIWPVRLSVAREVHFFVIIRIILETDRVEKYQFCVVIDCRYLFLIKTDLLWFAFLHLRLLLHSVIYFKYLHHYRRWLFFCEQCGLSRCLLAQA